MIITPIKLVQVHETPFKNTCKRLSNWIAPFTTILTTGQDKRRVGLLLTNKIIVMNCTDEVILTRFEFGEVKGTLFGCVPNTNLSFYYLDEPVEHHGFKYRKRDLTENTFLFGYLPFTEPCFYRFKPISVDQSKMFKSFKKEKGLNLSCDTVANALPIFDMNGHLFGFSCGNYNDESAVIGIREIAKALKK